MSIFKTNKQYLDMKAIFESYPDIKFFMFWSGRERGKSTNTLNYLVEQSYNQYIRFGIFYRYETTKAKLELYFNSKYTNNYLSNLTEDRKSVV